MASIALVMIARDEARCVERALRSAAPHVDEMCVLDTGSADDTAAIAARCGARVSHRRWNDDFAAARNASLAMTGCDWRLVLDADEWVAGDAAALHALRTETTPHLGLVCVTSLADTGAAVAGEAPSWLPRLLPRGVGYAGRVHEQPASGLPRRRHDLHLRHDGYLPAQLACKAGRNRRLLALALQQDPHDPFLHYQLGKDHEVQGEHAAAAPHYAKAASAVPSGAAWRHDLVVRRLFTLKKIGQHEQAFAFAQAQMADWAHSPDFFFALGDLLLDWAAQRPPLAGELLPLAEQSWTEALRIGENPALPDSVRGRGSWLAAHNLAVLCDGLGRTAEASQWHARAASSSARAEGRPRMPQTALGPAV